jgi:thiol-disulfide isomerase/thioredoxin
MKAFSRVRGSALSWLFLVVSICAILLGSLSAWALPEPGTPAPPLQFTQLLQAPPGAKADWNALRGKVVVLEFWATTCSSCVIEIPHLNQLAASLDPAKFQLIYVDNENPKVVQKFLAKMKMAGWVGIDTTSRVITRYGGQARPITVIVDGQGRIVTYTIPDNLTAADLLAVADGKSVKFASPYDEPAPKAAKASPAMVKPFYEISLSKAAIDSGRGNSHDRDDRGWDVHGYSVGELLSYINNTRTARLLPTSPLPEGLYTLRVAWAGRDDDSDEDSMVRAAVALGLNLRVQWKTLTRKVYVLKATETSKRMLEPTAMTIPSKWWGYMNGKIKLVNGSMDDLASGLEEGLDVPVVNETGIEGKFDAELEFPAKDVEAAKAALLKTLGLELIEAERPIQMLEVSQREEAKKAEEAKPQEAPKK